MSTNPLRRYFVIQPNWLIPRWWEIAYLIPPIGAGELREDWAKLFEVRPDNHFEEVVTKHLTAFLNEGVMPPDAIAPAILNMADDMTSGRKVTMRAGDYIALQSFVRHSGNIRS